MARRPTSNKRKVSFSEKGEGGGGSFHIPEDDYLLKVSAAEWDESANGNEMIAWKFVGLEGKAKGKTFYFYTTTTEDSVWKLRETLEALGVDIPEEACEEEIDPSDYVDLEVMGTVIDDEYKGKTKSKLDRLSPASGDSGDNKDTGKGGRSSGGGKSRLPKLSSDEVNAINQEELEDVIKVYKLDVDLADYKTLSKKRAAVLAALEAEEMIEDDPSPRRGRK